MDPSRYSVVVLYQQESQPYRINDDEIESNSDFAEPDYLPLLQSVFGRGQSACFWDRRVHAYMCDR